MLTLLTLTRLRVSERSNGTLLSKKKPEKPTKLIIKTGIVNLKQIKAIDHRKIPKKV